MANLKAAREAYRRNKNRNPFGLYTEAYGGWSVEMPANAAKAILGNEEIKTRTGAEIVQSTENGYQVKFVVTGDDFTEILKFLKRENVKAKYCLNDPGFTWKTI